MEKMSVVEKRIELLKIQNKHLTGLLDDSQPGLSTWLLFVSEVVDEINAIMDGKRDE